MTPATTSNFRIVLLLSGRGSNFAALKRRIDEQKLPIEIALVLSDKSNAPGLALAKEWGLKTAVVSRRPKEISNEEFNAQLAAAVCSERPDLVVLAGFMRILTSEFISPLRGKIINIHPSLLPSFRGLHAQQQALDAGVKVSGCTVHVALEELDAGPILAQAAVPVMPDDDEHALSERILLEEHKLLPAVVRALAEKSIEIRVHADNAVAVEFRRPISIPK